MQLFIYIAHSHCHCNIILEKNQHMNSSDIATFHKYGFVELTNVLSEQQINDLRLEADRRASKLSSQDLIGKHGCVLEASDMQDHDKQYDDGWLRADKKLKQIYIEIAKALIGDVFLVRIENNNNNNIIYMTSIIHFLFSIYTFF